MLELKKKTEKLAIVSSGPTTIYASRQENLTNNLDFQAFKYVEPIKNRSKIEQDEVKETIE